MKEHQQTQRPKEENEAFVAWVQSPSPLWFDFHCLEMIFVVWV